MWLTGFQPGCTEKEGDQEQQTNIQPHVHHQGWPVHHLPWTPGGHQQDCDGRPPTGASLYELGDLRQDTEFLQCCLSNAAFRLLLAWPLLLPHLICSSSQLQPHSPSIPVSGPLHLLSLLLRTISLPPTLPHSFKSCSDFTGSPSLTTPPPLSTVPSLLPLFTLPDFSL